MNKTPSTRSPIPKPKLSDHKSDKRNRYVVISSGKPDSGKSTIAVNLTHELGSMGRNVELFDADLSAGNATSICGVAPEAHIGHTLSGSKTFDDIRIKLSKNVSLYPNIVDDNVIDLTREYPPALKGLRDHRERPDFTIVNAPSGVHEDVIELLRFSDEAVFIIKDVQESLDATTRIIRVLALIDPGKKTSLLLNNVEHDRELNRRTVLNRLGENVPGFVPDFVGVVPFNSHLDEMRRTDVSSYNHPLEIPAMLGIDSLAEYLQKHENHL